jgi:hypothetical protein
MSKRDFLNCPHRNVQQFTECCLDCGENIWTTEEDYLRRERERARRRQIREDYHGDF